MLEKIQPGSGAVSTQGQSKRRHRNASKSHNGRSRYKPNYFGAIDLGTNNCRLLIAQSLPQGFKVVDSYSSVVRLGAGLASTGRLADTNMDAAVEAISVCAAKLKAKNVKRWRCIATQACRQAENGAEFIARIKRETGLAFETISPRVEARLSVMGVINIIDTKKDVALVIDIGGGSTEISWVDIRRLQGYGKSGAKVHRPPISAWVSLPTGVVSLSEMFPEQPNDLAGWYASMKSHVLGELKKQNADKNFTNVFQAGRGHIVGASGTVTSLASVHLKLPYYQRDKVDGIWMNASDIVQIARKLSVMSLQERQSEPCIGIGRASLLVAGCAIMDVICELWPSERIRVADRGLREGMLMGLMGKNQLRSPRRNGAEI
ncbi:MAG: Ppx/GppA phosphatase family protein [Robiginitomaculum sp.]